MTETVLTAGNLAIEKLKMDVAIMRRRQASFDFEKVFYQVIYGEVGIYILSWIYNSYVAGLVAADNPELVPINVMQSLLSSGVFGVWGIIYNWFAQTMTPQDAKEELAKLRNETLKKHGIPTILDDLFNKHFVWLQLGALGLPFFMEYRRVKRLKGEVVET